MNMDIFTTREVASTVWLIGLLLFSLKSDDVGKSFINVLKALFSLKIIFVLEALAVYLMLVCLILSQFVSWGLGEIKTAIFWFFFVGTVLLFQSIDHGDDYRPVRVWLRSTFTFIILLEFLTSKYTFALGIELLFVPVISIIAMMSVFAERNPEHHQVAKLCQWLLGIAGAYMFTYALGQFLGDIEADKNWEIAKDFSLPIIFSLSTIPFFYALYVYVTYENIFTPLVWASPDPILRKQVKRTAIKRFGLNLGALRRWGYFIRSDKPKSIEDVHKTISEAQEFELLSRNPPSVEPEHGWSPFLAAAFLKERGVKMYDYREYAGAWHADSHHIKTEEGYSENFMMYMIEGSKTVANKLRLKLIVNKLTRREVDLAFLQLFAKDLIEKALPAANGEEILAQIMSESGGLTQFGFIQICFECEVISSGSLTIEEYEFRIEI